MKRLVLTKYLADHGCVLSREGSNHTIFVNLLTGQVSSVPRHKDIHPYLARKICIDLGIPKITVK
jgi:hypothetical protein